MTNKALEHLGEDFAGLLEMKGFFSSKEVVMTRSLNLVSLIFTDVLAASSSTSPNFAPHSPSTCNEEPPDTGRFDVTVGFKVFVRGGAYHDQFNERALHDVHCEAG